MLSRLVMCVFELRRCALGTAITAIDCWVDSCLLLLPRLVIGDIPAAQAMEGFHSRQPLTVDLIE